MNGDVLKSSRQEPGDCRPCPVPLVPEPVLCKQKYTCKRAHIYIYQDRYLITYLNLLKKASWKKQINKFSCADIVVVDDCKQLTQQSLCFDEESCMLTSTKLQPIHTPLHPAGQSGITIVWLCTAMIWKTMSSWKLPGVSCSFPSKTSLFTSQDYRMDTESNERVHYIDLFLIT